MRHLTLSNGTASFSGTIEVSDDLFAQLVQAAVDALGGAGLASSLAPAPTPAPAPAPVVDLLKAAYDGLAARHTDGMSFDDASAFLFKAITSEVPAAVTDEAAIEIAFKWPDEWPTLRRSLKGYIEGALRNHGLSF